MENLVTATAQQNNQSVSQLERGLYTVHCARIYIYSDHAYGNGHDSFKILGELVQSHDSTKPPRISKLYVRRMNVSQYYQNSYM